MFGVDLINHSLTIRFDIDLPIPSGINIRSYRCSNPRNKVPPGFDIRFAVKGKLIRAVCHCCERFTGSSKRKPTGCTGCQHQVVGGTVDGRDGAVLIELCHVIVGFDHHTGSSMLCRVYGEHAKRHILEASVCKPHSENRCDLLVLPTVPRDLQVHERHIQFPDVDLSNLNGRIIRALVRDGEGSG